MHSTYKTHFETSKGIIICGKHAGQVTSTKAEVTCSVCRKINQKLAEDSRKHPFKKRLF